MGVRAIILGAVLAIVLLLAVMFSPLGALAVENIDKLDLRSQPDLARSMRNNNPGNLRPLPSGEWDGQVGVDADGYVIFSDMDKGIRAAGINLINYFQKDGVNTATDIAARWAPSTDNNDPVTYAQGIASFTGKGVDDPLDAKLDGRNILNGIFTNEYQAFANYVSDAHLWAGWKLATDYTGL